MIKTKFFSILTCLLLLILSSSIVCANEPFFIDLNKGKAYSSEQLKTISLELVEKYPDILQFESLTKTIDGRDLYVIRMSSNINESNFYTDKMHFLIDAGIHAREDVNPVILTKIIENYAKEYANGSNIGNYNIKDVLDRSVLHFVPQLNPDGFDLVRFGLAGVQTEEVKAILANIQDNNYPNFKANMRGVDINRNFPSFQLIGGEFKNIFGTIRHPLINFKPAGSYYGGEYGGSERETQAICNYIGRYDFRSLLTYHSRGNVVYWETGTFPLELRKRAQNLALKMQKLTGYTAEPWNKNNSIDSTGYASEYMSYITLKPTITLETLSIGTPLPAKQDLYQGVYDRTYLAPLLMESEGHREGYFQYRLYIADKYIRDYDNLEYAKASARHFGGVLVEGSGRPQYNLGDQTVLDITYVANKPTTTKTTETKQTQAKPVEAKTTEAKSAEISTIESEHIGIQTIEVTNITKSLELLNSKLSEINSYSIDQQKFIDFDILAENILKDYQAQNASYIILIYIFLLLFFCIIQLTIKINKIANDNMPI